MYLTCMLIRYYLSLWWLNLRGKGHWLRPQAREGPTMGEKRPKYWLKVQNAGPKKPKYLSTNYFKYIYIYIYIYRHTVRRKFTLIIILSTYSLSTKKCMKISISVAVHCVFVWLYLSDGWNFFLCLWI